MLSGDIKTVGVLEDVDMINNAKDIFDVIGDLIVDSVPGCKEEDVMSICSDLFDILKGLVTCYVRVFMCCTNLLTLTIPPNAQHKERKVIVWQQFGLICTYELCLLSITFNK